MTPNRWITDQWHHALKNELPNQHKEILYKGENLDMAHEIVLRVFNLLYDKKKISNKTKQ